MAQVVNPMRRTPLILALVLTLPLAAPAALAHDLPLTEASCGGTAPFVTSCTTGDHLWFGVGHTLFCGFEQSYVGTVVSWFEYAGGMGGISCTRYADGTLEEGQFHVGSGPAPLSTITHDCGSFDAGTFTAGGSGRWSCGITH